MDDRDPDHDAREAVARVVRDQLDALRAGDWERAYAHAARPLAAQLGREGFRRMVEEGYPALLDAVAAHVEEVVPDGAEAVARVVVVGPDGTRLGARYQLVLEDGGWKVTGVILAARLTAVVSLNGHDPDRRS
jgi:hypothetical protein